MEEKTIYKVALGMMIIGFAILLIYSGVFQSTPTKTIDTASAGEKIKLTGTVTQATAKEKVWFVKVEGCTPSITEAIIFTDESLYLQQGDYIEAEGTVEEYNGSKEVILSKVVKK